MKLKTSSSEGAAPRRFLVMGLPRSGTTYLMTLLNAHPRIYCTGEQFNPFGIVGINSEDNRHEAILERDRAPVAFLDALFARFSEDHGKSTWVGCKFMIGHNIRVLKALAERPDIALIYVWRENRLAQAASLIKALETNRWAQTQRNAHIRKKITVGPRKISQHWHELETQDHLFGSWLEHLPNPRLVLEYREMFQAGFDRKICDFLEVDCTAGMKSPLVKQGSNTILERFEDPKPIRYYFRQLGLERWLEDEL